MEQHAQKNESNIGDNCSLQESINQQNCKEIFFQGLKDKEIIRYAFVHSNHRLNK